MQSKLLNSDVPTENVASVFRIQSLFALGSDFIITELSVLRLHTTSCNYWVIIHPVCIGECKGIPDLLYKMWINEGCTGGYAGDHPVEKSFVSAEIQNPRQALTIPSVQELNPTVFDRGFYQKNPGFLWQQAPKWAEFHPHFTCFNCCSQVKNQPRATLWLAKQKLCWVGDSIPKGSSGQHSKSPESKEQHFVTHFILQLPHKCHSLANTENDNELFAFWPGYLNISIARCN